MCSWGSAVTWPRRGIWPRGATTCRSWSMRPTPGPERSPAGSAPGSPPTCSPASPTQTPARYASGSRCATRSPAWTGWPWSGRAHFGLRPDLPGAAGHRRLAGRRRSLNYAVLDAADSIRAVSLRCCTSAGRWHISTCGCRSASPPYITLPYVDRMDLAYAAADFAICRSGAMTCAELTAVGLLGPPTSSPPHGNGGQRLNAVPIEAAGGGLIIADADLTQVDPLRPVAHPGRAAQLVAAMSRRRRRWAIATPTPGWRPGSSASSRPGLRTGRSPGAAQAPPAAAILGGGHRKRRARAGGGRMRRRARRRRAQPAGTRQRGTHASPGPGQAQGMNQQQMRMVRWAW